MLGANLINGQVRLAHLQHASERDWRWARFQVRMKGLISIN